MNDQHVTAIATVIQDGLLVVSAVLVCWYLIETRKLRIAAQEQVRTSNDQVRAQLRQVEMQIRQLEAQICPAILVRTGGHNGHLVLVNLGKGPALHLKMSMTEHGSAGRRDLYRLGQDVGFIAADATHETTVTTQGGGFPLQGYSLQCEYKSLSDRIYWTVADFDRGDNNVLVATRFYSEGDSPDGS